MSRLSNEDRLTLLELARRVIVSVIAEKRFPDIPRPTGPLSVPGGAFVTLHRSGQLRGCVGQMENPGPLMDTVARAAINAALHDTRFAPVAAEELRSLEIEISVLSPLETVAPEAIVAGCHGLVVVRGEFRGVLLPQVATERRWTVQRFLEETCAKAGLPPDAWKFPPTQIFAFTADVFSEASLRTVPRI
jgi:AmmeMemoRadiSam system protein A